MNIFQLERLDIVSAWKEMGKITQAACNQLQVSLFHANTDSMTTEQACWESELL